MDESRKTGSAGEAVFVILFLFICIVILLYKFGGNKENITNPEITNDVGYLEERMTSGDENDIYNKYVKQIYDSQFAEPKTDNSNQSLDEIVDNYQKELLSKVAIPEQSVVIKNVSDKFNPKYYAQNFEIIFNDLKLRDGTTEGQILYSQIGDNNTLLGLSDYDREKILRIANEYEIFAEKISNLSTPTTFEKSAVGIAVSAKQISYILKKIVEEGDEKIYSLWISKYAENMSVIITHRYALQQL